MRPAVVVVLHPHRYAFAGIVETLELRTRQVFVEYRLPETLDFSKRLRVVRLAPEVLHFVFLKLHFKACLTTPVRILPTIVGQHFLGNPIFGTRLAIGLQNIFRRLARKKT